MHISEEREMPSWIQTISSLRISSGAPKVSCRNAISFIKHIIVDNSNNTSGRGNNKHQTRLLHRWAVSCTDLVVSDGSITVISTLVIS